MLTPQLSRGPRVSASKSVLFFVCENTDLVTKHDQHSEHRGKETGVTQYGSGIEMSIPVHYSDCFTPFPGVRICCRHFW